MSDDKDHSKLPLFLGILVGSPLGLFSFLAVFGADVLRRNDFLAGMWCLACMILVGLLVKSSLKNPP
jgi:hypothetical protein